MDVTSFVAIIKRFAPSTAIVAPVMKDALSDDRNTIDSASLGLTDALEPTTDQPAFSFVLPVNLVHTVSIDQERPHWTRH